MTASEKKLAERNGSVPCSGDRAFSLTEILVVTSIVGLLLALAAPGFAVLGPNRKMAIHEVSGFLENARARSVAEQSEMLVAFADGNFPTEEGAYRSYALFTLDGTAAESFGDRPVRQLSPWRPLPRGLVFAQGEHFEVETGTSFRTILDAPVRRLFPIPASIETRGEMVLPYLLFGPEGGILVPPFPHADALHVGIVEGFYDKAAGRTVLTSTRPGRNGRGEYANGECLEVGFYTGRSRILTD